MLDEFRNVSILLRDQPDWRFKLCALYILYETLTDPNFVKNVPIKWRLGNVKCDLYGEIIFDVLPATVLLAEALATALTEQEHTVLTGALDVCLELLRTASSLSDSETALIGPLVNIRSKVAPGVPLLAIFPRHVSFVQEPNITVYNR